MADKTTLKTALARWLHPVERLVDRIKGPSRAAPLIEAYLGYATAETLILRGRILSHRRRGKPLPTQGRWTNFVQMLSLFATDEIADVEVTADGVTTRSDEEGYFTLVLPRAGIAPGWHSVIAHLVNTPTERATLEVLVPDPTAQMAIISDIDDTLLETGAYSLVRNLWTSLTGNAATRHVFPDSIALIERLHAGRNPVFFVSSSPWNMFQFLTDIFDRHGLHRAPMFLRDLGLSETQFITGTHGDHKGAAIEALLGANPDLPFVLIGDTGQHDAHVYLDMHRRNAGRIARVILREPGPGPDDKSRAAMDAMRHEGVQVDSATDFSGIARALDRAMAG